MRTTFDGTKEVTGKFTSGIKSTRGKLWRGRRKVQEEKIDSAIQTTRSISRQRKLCAWWWNQEQKPLHWGLNLPCSWRMGTNALVTTNLLNETFLATKFKCCSLLQTILWFGSPKITFYNLAALYFQVQKHFLVSSTVLLKLFNFIRHVRILPFHQWIIW